MPERRELFEVMIKRVEEVHNRRKLELPQAFGRWFAEMYFGNPQDLFVSDGALDGKVDLFFTTHNGKTVTHHVLNTKFTKDYNKLAPASFYQEISYFEGTFENKPSRAKYLEQKVKPELRSRYQELYESYDAGNAHLMFVTNLRENEGYAHQIEETSITVFHLDDLIQHLIDDLDATMPRTPDLILTGIQSVLSPDKSDTTVSTSIVFAKIIDFIKYMKGDVYDLLFARNVRVAFSPTKGSVNSEIRDTFKNAPEEFVYSNNGITILCEKHVHDPGSKELHLVNPRVVNGSQTLHSTRDVTNPSERARVMVRIIEIPPLQGNDLPNQILNRKSVLTKISVRSNRQNPIKKWDLVSNDDFQLDLYRFFRRKQYFYERREREWKHRSRELKSVQIRQGPKIKRLAQLLASYYWNDKRLGPGIAKHSAGDLFEGDAYERLSRTSPEIAYQVYQVCLTVDGLLSDIGKQKRYVRNLKDRANFAIYSLTMRSLSLAGVKWPSPEFVEKLDKEWEDNLYWRSRHLRWKRFVQEVIDLVSEHYERESRAYKKANGKPLSHINYFKNLTSMQELVNSHLPKRLLAKAALIIED